MSFMDNLKKDKEVRLILAVTGAILVLGAVFATAFDKVFNKSKDNAYKEAAMKCDTPEECMYDEECGDNEFDETLL